MNQDVGVWQTRVGAAATRGRQRPFSDEVLDGAEVLDRVNGNEKLLAELVQIFCEDCPQWLTTIRESLDRGDAGALRLAAHTLRGAAGNFSARATAEAACTLETLGRTGDLTGAAAALATLEAAIGRLRLALTELVQGPFPANRTEGANPLVQRPVLGEVFS